jgi:hypothetical protein
MARLLSVKEYLGGADNVISMEMFPSDRKVVNYNFARNVSGYTFTADYQSILLDEVKYDRITGDVNLADTNVKGYFGNYATVPGSHIDTSTATAGTIDFAIPANRYTGDLFPSARTNVVMTVVSFEWSVSATPTAGDVTRHRWAIIERWEPGVDPGNPELDPTFVALGG